MAGATSDRSPRPTRISWAPASCRPRAMARPMPVRAPVTSAVLPSREKLIDAFRTGRRNDTVTADHIVELRSWPGTRLRRPRRRSREATKGGIGAEARCDPARPVDGTLHGAADATASSPAFPDRPPRLPDGCSASRSTTHWASSARSRRTSPRSRRRRSSRSGSTSTPAAGSAGSGRACTGSRSSDSGDEQFRTWASESALRLSPRRTDTSIHDLGFLFYPSWVTAYRLTGDAVLA